MRHFYKIAVLILTACMLLPCAAAPAAEKPGGQPIRPEQYQALLGRGMDVDWCKTSAGMKAYNSRAAHDFKEAGISHVRIRIKNEADGALLGRLGRQVEDCLDAGLIPVIAYQAEELKNDPSDENLRKVEQWWRTVAEFFRSASYRLSFDLIIEVTGALKDQPRRLNEIYERLVSAVRETNSERIIMIAPRLRSDAAYLRDLAIPSAANGYLMAEWHFYAAGPSKTKERKLWTTGTEAEKRLIQDKIDLALAWQDETGVPTWVGAWMPGNYNDGNDYTVPEQAAFAAYMTEALTKAGIPFAVNADTHFYDRENNVWIEEMRPVFDAIYAAGNVSVFSGFSLILCGNGGAAPRCSPIPCCGRGACPAAAPVPPFLKQCGG